MGMRRLPYFVFGGLVVVYAALLFGAPALIDRCTAEWLLARVTSWSLPALAIVAA